MASIRISEQAAPLLPFCRSSNSDGPHIWETFADLIAFLAAFGYAQELAPPQTIRVIKTANPIDLSTFRNRGLYPQLLMVAIAETRGWLVAKSLDEICAINERYAALGAVSIGIDSNEHSISMVRERLVEVLQHYSEAGKDKSTFQPA